MKLDRDAYRFEAGVARLFDSDSIGVTQSSRLAPNRSPTSAEPRNSQARTTGYTRRLGKINNGISYSASNPPRIRQPQAAQAAWKELFTVLILGIAVALAANATQVDLGYSAGFTPYDSYMRPVRQVLGNIDGESSSMDRVRALMREGRNFRYSFTQPHVASPPEVTEARRAGDCKDKALWLAERIGDENVRFVVGKARRTSSMSHAWLLWRSEGRWWVLDCTYNYRPIAADSVSRNEYIPMYSWSKNGVYRHTATRILSPDALSQKAR